MNDALDIAENILSGKVKAVDITQTALNKIKIKDPELNQWYLQAQRFRRWYRDKIRELFTQVDIIIAPTTPITAPLIGQEKMILAGEEILIRPHLGLFTQPLSFIGLPVLSVPIYQENSLPLGVQLIAAPYHESLILQVARVLEKRYHNHNIKI